MTVTINQQQATDLDLILQTSIDNEGEVYSVEEIHRLLFNDKDHEYCLNLFYILNNYYPTLLWPTDGPTPEYFWANEYAKAFIHSGGFIKIYNDEHKRVTEKEKIEALSLEKLSAEVEIVRFQRGLGKKLTIWGFAIATISVLASILTTIISNEGKIDNNLNPYPLDTISLKTQLQNIETRLQKLESKSYKDTVPK
jgi:hypothetical protein